MSQRVQLVLLAALLGSIGGTAYLASIHGPFPPIPEEVVLQTLAPTAYVVAGLLVARWRPRTRLATLLLVTGGLGFVGQLWLSNVGVAFTLGTIVAGGWLAVVLHLLLALPDGRLGTRTDRAIVLAVYLVTIGMTVGPALFETCADPFGFGCPGNVVMLHDDPAVAEAVRAWLRPLEVAAIAAVGGRLALRLASGTTARRRLLLPPIVPGIALLVALVLDASAVWDPSETTAMLVRSISASAVAIGILIGILRTRGAVAGLGDLAIRAAPGREGTELDAALAHALGDPLAHLAPPDAAAPTRPGRHRVSVVDREGTTLALLDLDVALRGEPELVEAVTAVARLALENAQLARRVQQQLVEVRASRARLAVAQDEERRRIERDLHDGAQQRLVSARLLLGLALEHPGTSELVRDAAGELSAAIDELREFARGVHPSLVSERGLVPAVHALAERSPLPVSVHGDVERVAAITETTAYFLVAECLTNVAKHARATAAEVRLERRDGSVVVEIADDGVGGAGFEGGSGLLGLRDRVEAAGGTLSVEPGPAGGTTVRGVLPAAGPAPREDATSVSDTTPEPASDTPPLVDETVP